jgi:hypothetical protein
MITVNWLNIGLQLLFAFCIAVMAVAFILLGFWMGRHTQEKDFIVTKDVSGGQILIEEDPYAEAMSNRKSEGSL